MKRIFFIPLAAHLPASAFAFRAFYLFTVSFVPQYPASICLSALLVHFWFVYMYSLVFLRGALINRDLPG